MLPVPTEPNGAGAVRGGKASRAGCRHGGGRKAAVPVTRWGLFRRLWAGYDPAALSLTHILTRWDRDGTEPRLQHPSLQHRDTGRAPVGTPPQPGPSVTPSPSCSLPNSPAENPPRRAPAGRGAKAGGASRRSRRSRGRAAAERGVCTK